MSRRTRYQQGSVQREKRQSGPDVWIFRWREAGPDGSGKQRKAIVGTVESLATEAAALKAAHALRIDANQQTPLAEGGPKTIAELIAHYRLKELAGEKQGRKAFSTRAGYESYLKCWIVPRWGDHRIDQIKSVAVEEWLDSIKRANGRRAKIRNIMSGIFHHAMRYEWLMKRHIRPVAKANGIHKKIGWHTFRHSFGTLLKANGEDVKTVQELLRHANSRITLDVYTQAVNSNKRAAQSKVVRMMVSDVGQKGEEKYPQTTQ